jgi:hypothetical protein
VARGFKSEGQLHLTVGYARIHKDGPVSGKTEVPIEGDGLDLGIEVQRAQPLLSGKL